VHKKEEDASAQGIHCCMVSLASPDRGSIRAPIACESCLATWAGPPAQAGNSPAPGSDRLLDPRPSLGSSALPQLFLASISQSYAVLCYERIGKAPVKLFCIEESVKAGSGIHITSDFGVTDQEVQDGFFSR
jgi:hypothetical protein